MTQSAAIYLAGTIQKKHERPCESYWTEDDIGRIRKRLSTYTLSFLNPALRLDDLSDQRSVFGRDMLQVFCSDVVFVDARDRRGLGVGAEMMWAKANRVPVVTWAPRGSHYHKDETTVLEVEVRDWIHPFVESLSDAIVETVEEGADWICRYMEKDIHTQIKDLETVWAAVSYYKRTQFSHDMPMRGLAEESSRLMERIESLQR